MRLRLIVTDTGMIWNHKNPILKKYKDAVLVVCLKGEKVTDDYECYISPYVPEGIGFEEYGISDIKFRALSSVAGDFGNQFGYRDEIVFLTDSEPSSLYPFFILNKLLDNNQLHLLTMSPLNFESNLKKNGHTKMLSDLSGLDSLLYYRINEKLKNCGKNNLNEFLTIIQEDLSRLFPRVLNGIHHMRCSPCYFDFASESYVPLKGGFSKIDLSKKNEIVPEIDFEIDKEFFYLGRIMPNHYPDIGNRIKEKVERPVVRVDGKKVCNILREQRIKLAAANGILFESPECPSIGPCAGTCDKCDRETEKLTRMMQLIPEEKRVYPQFDPAEEVKECSEIL